MQGLRDTGAPLSPFNSFLFLQGIETLHLRMERHSDNALRVAKFLEQHPGVEWVNYPGLPSSKYYERAKKYLPDGQSGLVTFGIKGGYEAGKKADQFAEAVPRFSRTSATRSHSSSIPASTTDQQLTREDDQYGR